ncbi:MAG: tRNA (guanosine(37)-N1)-methyltransferase TrmD [Actinobacteria bacterium]|nr:MAG: tRNA (guanosine(37)-N1)-methyltransferase TrmD [Actinomycetota bacterium]
MRISIVTLFKEFFDSPLEVSLVGRAIADGHIDIDFHDPRDHAEGTHRQVDDSPFGGGAGMVMMPEPLAKSLEPLENSHRVLFTPTGTPLTQDTLDRFATIDHLTLVCGRYEGVDQRVADHFIDEEISLGDFVLLGGEVAAACVIEGVARLLPGVIGNPASTGAESFRGDLLEEPVYTRPSDFRGWTVPAVLLSGDHGKIEAWRQQQRERRTAERRPDLLSSD